MADDVQIGVRDLGPIATGTVDLRPLTVFVGPSNTGKTYLSILIYALDKALGGFSTLPIVERSFPYPMGARFSRFEEDPVSGDEYLQIRRTLDNSKRPFMYSDLPVRVRSTLSSCLKESGTDARAELMRCFDSTSLSEFVRASSPDGIMEVDIRTKTSGNVRVHVNMKLSDELSTSSSEIADFVLLPGDQSPRSETDRRRIGLSVKQGQSYPVFLDELIGHLFCADARRDPAIHYLPAARSGIMQTYRVTTSSLVKRSTRVGLDRFPEIPALSGVIVDFMEQLILYRSERQADRLDQIATDLEAKTLGGVVRLAPSPSGFTEFVYRPHGTKGHVRMTRASSMVSELAPVVLFLRGVLAVGDTLIIEEPEAHLHPAAQTHVAVALARLVRAGVRVIITTHSDWLLKEIGNLMREGVLAEESGEPTSETALSAALPPREVGVWQFRHGPEEQGSTIQEIPFDRSEGVEPPEYDDVAEELYNRSANLQNKLEESRVDRE